MILEKVKTTEKIVRMIETENIIAFETSPRYKKEDIKKEVEDLFDVEVEKVRTHIRKNKKIAYVKLKNKYPAIDIATKLGVM
ncbi:MAG: 50S ribosomal protein L23 [Candidatus Nanoarchaeia archaeon]